MAYVILRAPEIFSQMNIRRYGLLVTALVSVFDEKDLAKLLLLGITAYW
jgi:hypothetical protein